MQIEGARYPEELEKRRVFDRRLEPAIERKRIHHGVIRDFYYLPAETTMSPFFRFVLIQK